MKTAVITYCDDNYEWELRHDFLRTIRKVGHRGTVHILDYGIKKWLCGRNLVVHPCRADMSIEQQRNRDIVRVLGKIDADVCMTIDAGDVWFQENFDEVFDMCRDRIGYVEELDTQPGNHKEWFLERILELKNRRHEVISLLERQPMIGSGMLVGPSKRLLGLLERVYRVTEQLGSDFFGVDQIALNYAIRNDAESAYLSLPQTYDYVLVTHRDEYRYANGIVYDREDKRVKIAHNAGGEHRLVNRRKSAGKRWQALFC